MKRSYRRYKDIEPCVTANSVKLLLRQYTGMMLTTAKDILSKVPLSYIHEFPTHIKAQICGRIH